MGLVSEAPVVASAARTVTGNSGLVDSRTTGQQSVEAAGAQMFTHTMDGSARFLLDVTAASGSSPTLDVTVLLVVGGVVTTAVVGTFAQKVAAGVETILIADCPKTVQINWVIGGGTPSLTFAVTAWRF